MWRLPSTLSRPYFHQHLVSRYPGTPADVRWHESDEWDGALHGNDDAIAELATRLRPYFD
jgi:histidine triad (HIT) family protein